MRMMCTIYPHIFGLVICTNIRSRLGLYLSADTLQKGVSAYTKLYIKWVKAREKYLLQNQTFFS